MGMQTTKKRRRIPCGWCTRMLSVMLLLALATGVAAQNTPGYRGDRGVVSQYRADALAQFQRLMGDWFTAVDAGDAVAAASLYESWSTLQLDGVASGQGEIASALEDWLGSFQRLEWGIRDFRISGSIAYGVVNLIVHGLHPEDERVGSMLVVLEVTGSGWSIQYHALTIPETREPARAAEVVQLLRRSAQDDLSDPAAAPVAVTSALPDPIRPSPLMRVFVEDSVTESQRAAIVGVVLESDSLKLELVERLAALDLRDDEAHRAFFEVADRLESDRLYVRAMSLLIDRASVRPAVRAAALEHATDHLESDYYRSELAIQTVANHAPVGAVGDALYELMASMEDPHLYARTMRAVLARERMGTTQVAAALEHAGTHLESDYLLSELLLDVLERYPHNGILMDAYVNAANSIEDDFLRNRVAGALVGPRRP